MALSCGLDDAAAIPAFPVPVDADDLRERLSTYPPELSYLSRGLAKRLDPALVQPGVRTVIAACMSYGGPHPGAQARPAGTAFVSRFAWCPDYHGPVGDAMARLAGAVIRPDAHDQVEGRGTGQGDVDGVDLAVRA